VPQSKLRFARVKQVSAVFWKGAHAVAQSPAKLRWAGQSTQSRIKGQLTCHCAEPVNARYWISDQNKYKGNIYSNLFLAINSIYQGSNKTISPLITVFLFAAKVVLT